MTRLGLARGLHALLLDNAQAAKALDGPAMTILADDLSVVAMTPAAERGG